MIPGMCDNLVILNLHLLKRDSIFSDGYQAIIMQWKIVSMEEETHLAWARTQNAGNGILGL